jgi:hypothetical protein
MLGTSSKLNPKPILNYFHTLDVRPTMPCYFAFGDENATPICSCDENAHMKSMCYGLILQHQLTINLFIQNLPCKALNVLSVELKEMVMSHFEI